ncbi:MAG TPA: hypothetical protein VME92_16690 [Acetobacteraceae bacterium]|nr:hypothetical protein [Acetobacteraceae bacterium]
MKLVVTMKAPLCAVVSGQAEEPLNRSMYCEVAAVVTVVVPGGTADSQSWGLPLCDMIFLLPHVFAFRRRDRVGADPDGGIVREPIYRNSNADSLPPAASAVTIRRCAAWRASRDCAILLKRSEAAPVPGGTVADS